MYIYATFAITITVAKGLTVKKTTKRRYSDECCKS